MVPGPSPEEYAAAERAALLDVARASVACGLREGRALEVDPADFFKNVDLSHRYLTKFRETLIPQEMTEDIVFAQAGDNADYRVKKIAW